MSDVQPKPKKHRRNKKPKQKKETPVPEFLKNPAVNRIPSKHTKQKARNQIKTVTAANKLSARESAIAANYVDNMLYPSRAIKLARPIPVRSAPFFKTGEITFESTEKWTEIQFQPDPWNFIRAKTVIASQVVTFTNGTEYDSNWLTLCGPNDQSAIPNGGSHILCFQADLRTTADHTIEQVLRHNLPAAFTSVQHGTPDASSAMGYAGLTCSGSITVMCRNNNTVTVSAAIEIYIVNQDGSIAGSSVAAGINIERGATGTLTSGSLAALTCNPTQIFVIGVRINNNSGGSNVFYKNFNFLLSAVAGGTLSTSSSPITRTWSLGEACYPNDDDLNAQIMTLFNESQLWSPVAMACLYNVSQQLSLAGGKFSASYLPSWVEERLPEDFSQEWSNLATYANSYPRYEGAFEKGAQATWVGQRIDDYMFRKPSEGSGINNWEANSMPINVFMSQRAAVEGNFSYFLTFAVCFEVQTLSPLLTMSLGPSSTSLVPMMLAHMVVSEHLVGENPTHFTRLKKLAKQMLSDPLIQQGFKTLAGAGLAALLP